VGSSGDFDELRLVPSSICQIFIRRNCQILDRRWDFRIAASARLRN